MGEMYFFSWEIVTALIALLAFIGGMIKLQMDTNEKIFVKIAEMKKDIEKNTINIDENMKLANEKIEYIQLQTDRNILNIEKIIDRIVEQNDESHSKISETVEKIYQILINKN